MDSPDPEARATVTDERLLTSPPPVMSYEEFIGHLVAVGSLTNWRLEPMGDDLILIDARGLDPVRAVEYALSHGEGANLGLNSTLHRWIYQASRFSYIDQVKFDLLRATGLLDKLRRTAH